jgi:LmbE family N-acetylglucosaminyl deacetylase
MSEEKVLRTRYKIILLVSGIILVLLAAYLSMPKQVKMYVLGINSLEPLDISLYQRILIFAPHNDDETLGQGGLIASAVKSGKQVKVVIATNGDGYTFATIEEFRKFFPSGKDYIKMGNVRQQESINALAVLGLNKENVTFLSYPDRGSPSMWLDNWSCATPYKSPFTDTTRSAYALTYNPNSQYCGENYLADVEGVIHDFHPDLVLYPHPEDAHPDHWGLSNFVRLALKMEQLKQVGNPPEQFAYLVHRPGFPSPEGYKPATPLLPPYKLYQINQEWYQVSLSQDMESLKWKAIQQYRSQIPSLRRLLESFVRTNELFARIESPVLLKGTSANPSDPSTWRDSTGQPVSALKIDPTGDFITRDATPNADITALYGMIDNSQILHICGEMLTNIEELTTYTLKVKTYGDKGFEEVNLSYPNHGAQNSLTGSGNRVCTVLKMADLHNPSIMMIGFETHTAALGTIDHIGWVFLDVPK